MKLSEMDTERGRVVLVKILPLLGEIARSEEAQSFFRNDRDKDEPNFLYGIRKLCGSVPLLLDRYAGQIYGILSAVNGVGAEEVRSQPLAKTIAEIKELVSDDALVTLFT